MADNAATTAGQDANVLELQQLRARYAAAQAEIAALRQQDVALAEEAARERAALAEAQEQQNAIADVLRVIASEPTSLQQMLDALVESVVRLIGGSFAVLWRLEGDRRVAAATFQGG